MIECACIETTIYVQAINMPFFTVCRVLLKIPKNKERMLSINVAFVYKDSAPIIRIFAVIRHLKLPVVQKTTGNTVTVNTL